MSPSPRAATASKAAYRAIGRAFSLASSSREAREALGFVYGELRCPEPGGDCLEVEVHPAAEGDSLLVSLDGAPAFEARELGSLLHELDNRLTVALELALPGLYFVHAAALAEGGRATLLVGDSGAGKSTTAYALAASGMDYLSDELAPIDPAAGLVLPYPRAICLKRDPPPPLALPRCRLRTERSLHVRPADLGCRVLENGVPVARILFVRYSPEHRAPVLRRLSPGEAALRLYRGALNQLSRPSAGLDDTLRLVEGAECLELLAAGIEETVRAIRGG
ncbi:MAG: hypothetical protein HY721_14215 [Planctomycetes bacterium]|nr:hypothetical protein [Planctomycetota bacterium]